MTGGPRLSRPLGDAGPGVRGEHLADLGGQRSEVRSAHHIFRFNTFGSSPWGSKVVSLVNGHNGNCNIHKACTVISFRV